MTATHASRTTRAAAALTAAAALLVLSACGSSSSSSSASSSSPSATSSASSSASTGAVSGKVVVFAASSLQQVFTKLGKEFQAANPGATVSFNFGGSGTLAASITSGAPADVFAAASDATMQTVTKAGDTPTTPVTFTKNTLEIAVAPGNPKHITSLADLTKPGVKVALCAKTEPCGAAAVTALADANVKLTPVTYEPDVTSAQNVVEEGQVDASLVYRTNVLGAGGKITGVTFPTAAQAVTDYPIAVLKNAPNATAAQAFVAFVLSGTGQQVLTAAGFQQP
ncbi:molybdate ABC transporter substrate-binding protein [Streptacidiphilus sp. PB12-B1b]|uniref:molybdate ABC transporter substrate-binding protein n=1 Tax=Streptacidiphilus sp. PB12-B1b TaxID=2705012 RepID=UPI0015FBE792|nr:molybdate ABC transporter substrate-binding protein [Streptacidiphilus sp. PB12-B1b]QMU76974.1 molybdate ABC transporter substrate-binding protein [Streptacidiphilus sp. PB12-B1b]